MNTSHPTPRIAICALLLAGSAAVGRAGPLLDGGSPVTTINRETIENLPTNARDPLSFLKLTPGVVTQPVIARGASSGATWNVDGVNITDPAASGAATAYLNVDSFSDFHVRVGGGGTLPGTGGLPVTIVTRAGTDKGSGSLGLYAQDAAADAYLGADWAAALEAAQPTYYGRQPGMGMNLGRAVLYSDTLTESAPLRTMFPLNGSFGSHKLDPGLYTLQMEYTGWESWRLPIRVGDGYGSDFTYMTTLKPKPAEAIFELSIPYTDVKLPGVLELDDFGQVIHDRFGGYDYDTTMLDFGHASGEVLAHWRDDEFDRLLLNVKVPFSDAMTLSAEYKWDTVSLIGPLRTPALDPGVDLGGPVLKDKLWFFTDQTIREAADAGLQWRTPLGYKGAGCTFGDWDALSPRVGLTYDNLSDGATLLNPTFYNDYPIPQTATEQVITFPSKYTASLPLKADYWDVAWGEGSFLLSDQKGAAEPNDPLYDSTGSWKQTYDDQWALKRVGFTPLSEKQSAWHLVPEDAAPVLVAVIDSGCDMSHPDLAGAIWTNAGEIPGNHKDDDGNGYVDDVHGWNFIQDNPDLRDYNGHGTVTAGIIAARRNNGIGISGVNPHAVIMPVRATDYGGNGGSIELTKAILYAVDNGARVINVSIGGAKRSRAVQAALNHAHRHGVVVVAAAGNDGVDTRDFTPAGLDHIITVSSSDLQNRRSGFSNWGQGVDLAAPGIDVLSLRARSTDIMVLSGPGDYTPGSAVVGADRRYYRASGTSFSAPLVSGAASLLLSCTPGLTADQVRRMLLNAADDIENPGWDQYTGYGLLNAARALQADPDYETRVRISAVAAVQRRGGTVIELSGVADSSEFKKAWLELGEGAQPTKWRQVAKVKRRSEEGVLGSIETKQFKQAGAHSIRLMVATKAHGTREAWSSIDIQ